MISLVAITPSKLVFNAPALRRAVETALDNISGDIKSDLEATTADWHAPPLWAIVEAPDRRDIVTQDAIFHYQDKGTRAHVIMPRSARRLVFQVPSGVTVFAKKVNHPGTKPQNFTLKTALVWQAKVGPVFQAYIGGVV